MGHNDTNSLSTPRVLFAACVLAGLAAGCGDEESSKEASGQPPVFAAADSSKSCPPGYVGWDFATGGSDPLAPELIDVLSISCEGLYRGLRPEEETRYKDDLRTSCTGFQSCNAYLPCEKSTVTWKCGESDVELSRTVMRDPNLTGNYIDLSCYVAVDADAGVVGSTETPVGKACVPKTCPTDSYRDANMQCVPGPKQKPEFYLFGPPIAVPLQKTSANENAERLVGGTEYLFATTLYTGRFDLVRSVPYQIPQGRLTFWFADEYVRKNGSRPPVQGFRCAAASAEVSPSNIISSHPKLWFGAPKDTGYVTARSTISPECIKQEFVDRAKQDAARRAGVALADFERDYRLERLRLHTSFDLEGRTIVPDKLAYMVGNIDATCAPNPPGLFYRPHPTDPARSYIDWFGYYTQREAAGYGFPTKPYIDGGPSVFDDALGGYFYFGHLNCARGNCFILQANNFHSGASFGTRSSEVPTRIRVGAKSFRVNDPELTVRKFGTSTPSIDVDVGYYLAGGDNKSNPYAFGGASGGGAEGLSARTLRADVYLRPDGVTGFNSQSAMLIGSVPLKEGPVTGASVAGKVSIARSKVRRFFDEWADKVSFRVFYCLSAKGLSTVADLPQVRELPNVVNNGVTYGAGIDDDGSACIEADTVIALTRDYARTPADPASASPNSEAARDEASGDSNTQGSQGNATEQGCSGNSCSLTQNGDMAASGMFGNTIFDASTESDETQNEDGSGDVSLSGNSEIFGFQVLDSPEDESFMWADEADVGPKALKFEYSVDWAAIEEAIDEAISGTKADAKTGRYGGRDGLGIAYGYKTRVNIGPIPGEVNVGVSAGVGLAISFEIGFAPDKDYPCMVEEAPAGGTADKCYMLLSEAATQANARSECAQRGGVLFEARSDREIADLRKLIDDNGGSTQRFWLGGQQGYEYPGAACAAPESDADKQACARNAKLSYRWLSDDATFAKATGFGQVSVESSAKVTATDLQLVSQLPSRESAVAYDTVSRRLITREPNELMIGVCAFEPASDTKYLSFTGGIGVGVSAGLFMSFCTPSEDLGVCLEGGLNFVSVEMAFNVGQETHTITEYNGGGTFKVGGSFTRVPWSLSILSGYIQAVFKLFFFDITVPIVEWPGFKIADEPLFESYKPVVSREP